MRISDNLMQTKLYQAPKKETTSSMFRIQTIIDGNTIRIVPIWNWNGRQGDSVTIKGYGANPSLAPDMKAFVNNVLRQRLTSLLPTGTVIQLKNPTGIDAHGRLICDVLLNGVSVSNYFPEYKL